MGDGGRSSILVHILVIALCLAAFGFAIAAERRRSTVLYTLPQAASFFPFASCIHDQQASCKHLALLGLAEIWGWILALVLKIPAIWFSARVLRLSFFNI